MPLGISESLIQRAYAPVDLSGFYKGIDEASKLAAAEARAEKKLLQKEYYNSVAVLSKDMDGIKSQDMPEVNMHYAKWKNLQQRLMKTSFNRNPEEYARLNAEANAEYGLTMSTIGLSKQKKKEHEVVYNNILNNPFKYTKGAIKQWQNVMLMPTSQAISLNDKGISNDDISSIQYTGPTIAQRQKFEDQIRGKDIYSGANVITYSDNENRFAGKNYEVVDPVKVKDMATTYLSIYSGGEQGKFAESFIDNNKNNVDEVKKAWDALPEANFEGFKVFDPKTNIFIDKYPLFISPITGKQTRKLDLFASDDPAETFIGYATAKAILTNPAKEGKLFTQFPGGDMEKAKFNNKLATDKALTMAAVQNQYALNRQQKGFNFRLEELPEMQKLLMIERTMNNLNNKAGEGEIYTWMNEHQGEDPTELFKEIYRRGLNISNTKPLKDIPITPSFGQFVPGATPGTKPTKRGGKSHKKTYVGLDDNGYPIYK